MRCSAALIFNSCFSCPSPRKLDWKLGGKGWWEWGSRSILLCDVITAAAVISDGTCHEYFSLKWISDNSEWVKQQRRQQRGTNDSLKIIVRSQFYFITSWRRKGEILTSHLLTPPRRISTLLFEDYFLDEKVSFWCKLRRIERNV